MDEYSNLTSCQHCITFKHGKLRSLQPNKEGSMCNIDNFKKKKNKPVANFLDVNREITLLDELPPHCIILSMHQNWDQLWANASKDSKY